eukprot:752211-Hanusia_phi.AAC.3
MAILLHLDLAGVTRVFHPPVLFADSDRFHCHLRLLINLRNHSTLTSPPPLLSPPPSSYRRSYQGCQVKLGGDPNTRAVELPDEVVVLSVHPWRPADQQHQPYPPSPSSALSIPFAPSHLGPPRMKSAVHRRGSGWLCIPRSGKRFFKSLSRTSVEEEWLDWSSGGQDRREQQRHKVSGLGADLFTKECMSLANVGSSGCAHR